MTDTREIIKDWLKDAHAMEHAALDNLEHQVDHLDDYPELKAKLEQQIEITRSQEQRIDQQLRALGTDPSTMKDAALRIAGRIQALMAGAAPDDVVKQATSTLAYENWEIANYRALAAAAETAGDHSMCTMFEEMANEKVGLMNWLSDALPTITQRYIATQSRA